jgi:peptidoglycan/xylan/chitin deacetylase (PgdA/CDA1 family)
VAITIDDGPEPTVTPQVLDLLDAAGARASFFCIGRRALEQPQLVREIVARGHSVENHSMNHLKRFATLGPAAIRRELADAQACLADIAGVAPRFFRPTAGLRSPLLDPQLTRLDLLLASWTRRAYDTRCGDPAQVHGRLTRLLAAGDILLLHDGHAAATPAGRPVILEVLPVLLDTLRQAGLKAVTLPATLDTARP